MEDPFKYVQPQEDKNQPQTPVNVAETPPPAPISTLQQQARYKKIALISIVAVVVLAAIGGIFLLLSSGDTPQQPAQQQSATETPAGDPAPEQTQITSETETYTSQRFFLSFAHPVDWNVEEDTSAGVLTLTSPEISLPGATANTQGIVTMTIRKPTAELPEFEAGNALAVIPSQKITYANPSSAQRGDTYVSYLSFADSASNSLIDGVYITGDFGYKKDQAIPKVDIQKIDPIISVRFYACDGQCTEPMGTGSDLPSTNAGEAILAILKSLKIN